MLRHLFPEVFPVLNSFHSYPASCSPHQPLLSPVRLAKESTAPAQGRVQSLGWDNPLEKGMATHSSIFAWKISWTEEPGRLQSMGL